MATNMIRLKCQNCGADLNIDINNMIVYCPYCGQKLFLDVEKVGELLLEKEKTKQKEIDRDLQTKKFKHEEKRNEDNRELKWAIVCFGFIAIMIIAVIIGMAIGVK